MFYMSKSIIIILLYNTPASVYECTFDTDWSELYYGWCWIHGPARSSTDLESDHLLKL